MGGRRLPALELSDSERSELKALASRRKTGQARALRATPTSASWLNQVERFFALITERKIWRGIYRSVAALRADIRSFLDQHNADPKPFKWTKSADHILASIERFCLRNTAPNTKQANF
jgi:hypothetical protein